MFVVPVLTECMENFEGGTKKERRWNEWRDMTATSFGPGCIFRHAVTFDQSWSIRMSEMEDDDDDVDLSGNDLDETLDLDEEDDGGRMEEEKKKSEKVTTTMTSASMRFRTVSSQM